MALLNLVQGIFLKKGFQQTRLIYCEAHVSFRGRLFVRSSDIEMVYVYPSKKQRYLSP
jgi:hypothetical protein